MIKFKRYFFDAITNILSAKLRSALAILGVLVGTAAVVALISSSQLATAHAVAQFKTLGTQLLAVSLYNRSQTADSQLPQKLTLDSVKKIKGSSAQIINIAPYTYTYNSSSYRKVHEEVAVVGVTDAFKKITQLQVSQGRFVSNLDRSNYFAVIGSNLEEKLKAGGLLNPIGHQLLIGNLFFTVIGILEPWQSNLFVSVPINDSVIIPIAASYLLGNETSINNLIIKLSPDANVKAVENQVKQKILELVPSARVNSRSPEQILKLVSKQRVTFTWLLGAIGGISLFVGAIGVMNILLVSVVERRREIGVRLAIGAQQKEILVMFLIESIVLTVIGGTVGVITGVVFSYVFAHISHWEFQLFLIPPLLGFSVSVIVGILSGFYPALRASRLDPITSLRSE